MQSLASGFVFRAKLRDIATAALLVSERAEVETWTNLGYDTQMNRDAR